MTPSLIAVAAALGTRRRSRWREDGVVPIPRPHLAGHDGLLSGVKGKPLKSYSAALDRTFIRNDAGEVSFVDGDKI